MGGGYTSGGDVTYRYERKGKYRRTSTIPRTAFIARFEPVPVKKRGRAAGDSA